MAIRDGIRDSLHQQLDDAKQVFALDEVQRLLDDFSSKAAKPEDL